MKLWKRFCGWLLAVTTCISLAACGSGQAGNGGAGSQEDLEAAIQSVLVDKEEVNITFWTGTGQQNYPYLEAMVQNFEEEYPNIHVELSNQGPVSDLMDKLTQNIVSETTPTLSNITPTYFLEYINSGAIIDMMPYYSHEEIGFTEEEKAAFYPSYIEEAMSFGGEGTMYGFPTNKKTADIFFYNRTYFEEQGWSVPETWDQVVEYSRQIKEDTGMPGFSYDVAYPEAAFKTLSMQWGSPYLNADGTASIDNDNLSESLSQ